MTVAPNLSVTAVPPTLLPGRDVVLERLQGQLPTTDAGPATLVVIGLHGDGSPECSALITGLLARSLRADDWLGGSGPAEYVVVLSGAVTGAACRR